ncbi:MAG TPA: ABC transporter substrate-binding protein [Geobacteraceae bacterium]|nr:ABC transporter substrate-binding protein [Geobacteraceae bacterium]
MKNLHFLLKMLVCGAMLSPLFAPHPADAGTPIRFAYQDRVGSALCIVAVEKGLFAEQGLAVRASRFTSGPACAEALYSGSADIGEMGDTTAVIAVSRGDRFRIIASHGGGEHRHRIVVRSDGAIRKPGDLVGKKLAIKKGTSTYGGFLAYCGTYGIDIGKIRVIDLNPALMPEALSSGAIDAFIASEPTPSLAETRGAIVMGTLGELGNSYPLLVLARKDFLDTRPGDVKKFLKALQQAEAFIKKHPKETAAIIAGVSGLSVQDTEKSMKLHDFRLTLDPGIVNSLKKIAAFLYQQGKIKTVPDFSHMIESSWLPPPCTK